MADFESQLKTAYDRRTAASGTPEEKASADAYQALQEAAGDDACITNGEIWPERDYGEYECRRRGAEAPYDEDNDWDA